MAGDIESLDCSHFFLMIYRYYSTISVFSNSLWFFFHHKRFALFLRFFSLSLTFTAFPRMCLSRSILPHQFCLKLGFLDSVCLQLRDFSPYYLLNYCFSMYSFFSPSGAQCFHVRATGSVLWVLIFSLSACFVYVRYSFHLIF